MSITAKELGGQLAEIALRTMEAHGTKRTHLLGDDDEPKVTSTPSQQREAILAALREEQPRDRQYFRDVLGIDGADLELALTKLRDKGLVYGIQGEGYRLGRRPMPVVAGTPVLKPSKETTMPKGHYDRSKAKRGTAVASDEGAGDVKATKRKKRATHKAVAVKPRATKARATPGGAQFIVDDAGAVSIVAGEYRIELSTDESTRLHTFLERTKTFRE